MVALTHCIDVCFIMCSIRYLLKKTHSKSINNNLPSFAKRQLMKNLQYFWIFQLQIQAEKTIEYSAFGILSLPIKLGRPKMRIINLQMDGFACVILTSMGVAPLIIRNHNSFKRPKVLSSLRWLCTGPSQGMHWSKPKFVVKTRVQENLDVPLLGFC